jgi:molybdopterin converting factor subunit 1
MSMTIKVLAFGIAKDIMGGSSESLQTGEEITVDGLRSFLEEKYAGLKQLSSFRIALNNEFASGKEIIRPGDEIAIIPPVSGG